MLGGRVVLQRDDNPAPVAGPAPAAGTTAGAPAAAAAPTGPVTVGFELTGGTMSGEALSNLVSGKSVSVGTGLGSATTETLTLSTA